MNQAGIRLHTQRKKTHLGNFSRRNAAKTSSAQKLCTTFHHLGIDEGLSLNLNLPQ